ncbi:hypothetical protein CYR55_15390 [Chimaeribacter californicus]|jgi:predicted small lipoprotein YifL|uniref:LPS-assembly lipoprotein LptM n=1 Tax=Chimaeribacter californicus TaxID=2060067 RepID=A0A2N5E1G5_9GAMM|nr:lipoprotein [Chimaeribacter californicus]PLR34304.1 hypothetical protein CYR55_15390 [Chimaeribacter californicus]
MKKQLRWALAAVTLLGLSGCGLKGPLYFPPAEKPKAATSPSTGEGQRNQQSSSGTQSTSSSAGM